MRTAAFLALLAVLAVAGTGWGVEAPEIVETRVTTQAWWMNPQEVCPSCSIFTTQPFMATSLDEETKTVSASMGVMNASGVSPVEGATIFVSVYDSGMNEISGAGCRVFTDEKGSANFSYEGLPCEGGCIVRMVFCCSNPVELACVLPPCLGKPEIESYADVRACGGYGGAWPEEATVNGESIQLYPTADEVVIPPQPPAGFSFTFTFCFPLLVIFGFLLAAMYASGRDPFAMFSFYAPRYTRGAERPIAGRGASVSATSLYWATKSLVELGKDLVNLARGEKPTKLTGPIGQVAKEKEQYEKLWEVRRVETVPGTGQRPQPGMRLDERAKERAIAGPSGGVAAAVGQMILGAPVERPSAEGPGMGFGATIMKLLALILKYSNAPWLTAPLAEAAEGLANEWIRERQAEFGERVVPAMLNGMDVKRDAGGNVVMIKLDYVDPRTGERVQRTIEGREACAEFIGNNITAPIGILIQNYAERGVQLAHKANVIIAGQNPVSGAREALRAEGARAGGPTGEALAALQVLADPNSSDSARRSAFKIIAASDLSADVKINAFVVATEGMDYEKLGEFLRTAPAASVLRMIKEIDSSNLLGTRDGNLLAALSAASARLDAISSSRAEGREDTLRLGEIVANARAAISECGGHTFGYREGTEGAAEKIVAMGLSGAALAVTASMEAIPTDLLSPKTREEIETLMDKSGTGNVNVTELSERARQEISEYLKNEVESALFEAHGPNPTAEQRRAFYDGDSREAMAYRAFTEAVRRYETLTRDSVEIMERASMPGIEAARGILSQAPPIVGPNGELARTTMPDQLVGNWVVAALLEHGVNPELARVISDMDLNKKEGEYLSWLRNIADSLASGAAGYAGYMAGIAAEQQERVTGNARDVDTAFRIISDRNSTEASRMWALGMLAQMAPTGTLPTDQPEQMEQFRQRYYDAVQNQLVQAGEQQDRYDLMQNLLSRPTAEYAAEYARIAGDDRATAAERAAAQQAVETLLASSDEAARAEAARTLNAISPELPPELRAHVGVLTGGPPPAARPADIQQSSEQSAAALRTGLDAYYDQLNITRAAFNPGETAGQVAIGLATELEKNYRELLGAAGAAARSLEETRLDNTQFQIALYGNDGVRRFYINMEQQRRIAEEAARIAQTHTTQTELGMPVLRGPGTGGRTEQPPP